MHQGKKQTIGIVLTTVPKYSETFFRNKIKGLQEHGFEVLLFVDYASAQDTEFPCKVVVANKYGHGFIKTCRNIMVALFKSVFTHPKQSWRLYQLDKSDGVPFKQRMKQQLLHEYLLSYKVDWLHFGFGMLAVGRENVAEALGARMAVSFRGFDLYLSPLKHRGCYKTLFKKPVYYHVLSEEMKRDLMAYQIPETCIKVITPAINVDFFTTDIDTKTNERLEMVTIARLHWKKGLEYTLQALAMLRDKHVDFHYTIIGAGDDYERLVLAAHQWQLTSKITFAGKLTPDKVKKQLERSDVYLQYSVQEGFCNAVLEAQAMGLLCIVSDAEGLSENVLDGTSGWVVPKRRPDLLAAKISEVINLHMTEQHRIRTFAQKRVQVNFHLKQQNEAFANFYNPEEPNK